MSFMYGPALDIVKVLLAIIIVATIIRLALTAQQNDTDWEQSYQVDADPTPTTNHSSPTQHPRSLRHATPAHRIVSDRDNESPRRAA
ncbi:hypothetical protein [Gordonia otitidis]|uniref:Uncharacterized protein n=1 Tax=Gordonia otitidis (strain DSM 44809 / CCUG 52243 / JCM 12355 / NBRC 100426 / IFM 10032) TaxID=1108044 RepID=H5TS22_GORO1|nr:hypothetical protein [Gordonia otitidis]GAB36280.1 hypothetical protein GOOTI_206_00130 [Gordonia otitidis NBRC 100426]